MTKKLRFEVYKRDRFTCQYCGRKAPDVILHVDHVKPVSAGGEDHILNLVTSCFDCNMGKKDRKLSDDSYISKVRQQLEASQEKIEQMEMMFEWHEALKDIYDIQEKKIIEYFDKVICNPRSLNDNGKKDLKKYTRGFQLSEILEAIDIADKYVVRTSEEAHAISVDLALSKIGGILKNMKKERENPYWHFIVDIFKKLKYGKGGHNVYLNSVERAVMDLINDGWKPSSILTRVNESLEEDYGYEVLNSMSDWKKRGTR